LKNANLNVEKNLRPRYIGADLLEFEKRREKGRRKKVMSSLRPSNDGPSEKTYLSAQKGRDAASATFSASNNGDNTCGKVSLRPGGIHVSGSVSGIFFKPLKLCTNHFESQTAMWDHRRIQGGKNLIVAFI
jgi:hypothetical protein